MTHATTLDQPLDQRKAEILRLAQDAVHARGQRRRARHHALLALLLTAGVTVLAITLAPTSITPSTPRPIAEAPPQRAPAASPIITPTITRVATTPGLSSTLSAGAGSVTIARVCEPSASGITRVATTSTHERIGDARALELLAQAGRPAGLIRIEGRTTLVYQDARSPVPGPGSDAGHPDAIEPAGRLLALLRPYRPG